MDGNESEVKNPGVRGLYNLGNTCYMNAALQSVSNCPQLTEHIIQCLNTDKHGVTGTFKKVLAELWQSSSNKYSIPYSLLREIQHRYPIFSGHTQHDAQEFLRVFLCCLHDELQTTVPRPPTQSTKATNDAQSVITEVFQGKLKSTVCCLSCNRISQREEPFLDLSLPLQVSEVSLKPLVNAAGSPPTSPPVTKPSPTKRPLANGVANVRSPAKRKRGNRKSTITTSAASSSSLLSRFTPSAVKSSLARWMPVSPHDWIAYLYYLFFVLLGWLSSRLTSIKNYISAPPLTLDGCLSEYFSHSDLRGENRYRCERCKRLSDAVSHFNVLKLPEVLCVHLKRFDHYGLGASKISTDVLFPLTNLDLRPYLDEHCSDQVMTYDLMSVVCHRGGCTSGGHYTCCAFNWVAQKWYEYDDVHVTEVPPDYVEQLTSSAYVLFYRKQDHALAPFRDLADSLFSRNNTNMLYISRAWLVRFATAAEPGPITNNLFLCCHGDFKPHLWQNRNSDMLAIPEELWSRLSNHFGGGPRIDALRQCQTCLQQLERRQIEEADKFDLLCESNERLDGQVKLYAISAHWFDDWQQFVNGLSLVPPPQIDNTPVARELSMPSTSVSAERLHLACSRSKTPCKLLSAGCWNWLVGVYTGGPAVSVLADEPSPPPANDESNSEPAVFQPNTDLVETSASATAQTTAPPQHNSTTSQLQPISAMLPNGDASPSSAGILSHNSNNGDSCDISEHTCSPTVISNGRSVITTGLDQSSSLNGQAHSPSISTASSSYLESSDRDSSAASGDRCRLPSSESSDRLLGLSSSSKRLAVDGSGDAQIDEIDPTSIEQSGRKRTVCS